jgi:hypothetical protein
MSAVAAAQLAFCRTFSKLSEEKIMARKWVTILTAASLTLAATTASASFSADMTGNLVRLQAEVEAQLRANPDIAQMVSKAAAAGIDMPILMRVLGQLPAVNIATAVRVAVSAVPGQGVNIVGSAVLYGGSAQSPAIITAGIQAAPAQASGMLGVILGALNLSGKKALQTQVFQSAIAAAPDQLETLVATAMRQSGRPDVEWAAVTAVRAGAAVNPTVSSALRTNPERAGAIITAVLRAAATPAAVDTAAHGAGIAEAVIAAAFSAAGIAYPLGPQGQILALAFINGPTVAVNQIITLRIDGSGTCSMETNYGNGPVIWNANRPNFWGVPFNALSKATPGTYVFNIRGVPNAALALPACQGSAQVTVNVVAR